MPRAAGDAVAFSVEAAAQRPLRRSDKHAALPLCLLRVERRRSERHVWERVLDELVGLRAVNFVARLERHRYEYRLSLQQCSDPQVVALPSQLLVARIQNDVAYQHPHVGSFRVVKVEPPSVQPTVASTTSALEFVPWVLWFAMGILGLWLLVARWKAMMWTCSQWWPRVKSFISRATSRWGNTCAQSPNIRPSEQEQTIRVSSTSIEPAHRRVVLEEFEIDDEEDEADPGKELLMTELPDFNDEIGWRDFFDSQIYQREDREQQPEKQDPSESVRLQRKVITRLSYGAGSNGSDGPVKFVTAQPRNSLSSASDVGGIGNASQHQQVNSRVVTSMQNATSLRQSAGRDIPSETATTVNKHPATKSSAMKQQTSRTSLSAGVQDDFGEFWQM